MDQTPDHPTPEDLAPRSAFARLAEIAYSATDLDGICQAVVAAAPDLVSGCDHASLMVLRNGRAVTFAASDDVARQIDAMEQELRDGPCLDALVHESAYVDGDLTDGSPWPVLGARVLAETSVRGMAGFRLLVQDQKLGALNVFSDTAGALDERSINEAIMLGSFIAVALMAEARRESAESLRAGLSSNREIGKAVGLMMAFHKCSDTDAFEILRRASQDMNLKLVEIAREVVSHHNSRRP